MKRIDLGFFIFIVLLFHFKLICQTVEPSRNVAKHNLQLEIETTYSVEKESKNKTTSWNIPNILIRYGLSNNFELQFHTPFTKERCFENNQLTSNIFKFEEMEFGASVNLWKQNKIIPETAVMARLVLPTKNFNSNGFGNIISLNFSNVIWNNISLNYNVGSTTNLNKNTFGFYIVNFSYQSTNNLRFFIENSGMFNKNTESNCLGTGFGTNLSHSIGIDFSIAKSLKNNMFYSGAIITWVINTNKKG
jgi:hypothetical protein